jgi:oligoribonuclease
MEWLLWVDIETTGLDPEKDAILQIACILTDFHLTIQHTFGQRTLHQSDLNFDNWNPWCVEQHTKSKLIDDMKMSQTTLTEAEISILCWLNSYVAVKDILYVAGNSVHFDKRFIDKHMPMLSKRLSHRIVDVTSFALVCKQTSPEVYDKRPQKAHNHTALEDVLESIAEYRYYLG